VLVPLTRAGFIASMLAEHALPEAAARAPRDRDLRPFRVVPRHQRASGCDQPRVGRSAAQRRCGRPSGRLRRA